ncbi:class I adenylate-forming enzyme family protein [Paenibacillus humicus]|uniref:class I adenylate-forming enzyme family protein n=1 Tax=Paenibacillus humicus TaxID=412861 RepID=UPI003D287D4B
MYITSIPLLLSSKVKENELRILVKKNNVEYSYGEILANSKCVKSYIEGANIPRGSHIGICLNNGLEFIYCLFGIWLSGRVPVPLPYNHSELELNNAIKFHDLAYVLSQKQIEQIDFTVADDGYETEAEACESTNELALLLPTSGSTGNPKTVMLSHGNIISNAIAHGKKANLKNIGSILITMPMHFSSTIVTQILSCIIYRTTLHILEYPIFTRKIIDLVNKEKIAAIAAVPTTIYLLIDEYNKNKVKLHSFELIIISGASLRTSAAEILRDICPNADIVITYGLTEASPRISMMARGERKLSSGKPVENVEVIVKEDDNYETNGRNKIGRIYAKGPNIMMGYYKNEKLTRQIMKDGWLDTEDLGYIDEEGDLHVVGRNKNIIIVGGINVYPEETEEFYLGFDEIQEIIVISISDQTYGEAPVGVVRVREGHSITTQDLTRMAFGKLSVHKIPKKWIFSDDPLPKTVTGKYQRNLIKNMFLNTDRRQYE